MAEISGRFPQGISQQTVSLLITISLYYSLLILLMPWLRRVFRPKACASFWVLPNVLYISSYAQFQLTPIVYLPFPEAYLRLVIIGWLAGFVIILGWQVFQHIRYRRRILGQAASTADEDLIQDWRDSLKRHDISTDIPLKITEAVSSPVTIGLFDRHMVLVLPNVTYTPEDRRLIFAHEARHIMGSDSKKKFLVAFCTAMTWFNPFSWIARKKVSQDLELSNDESVLKGADEATRRRYAELILDSSD